MAIFTLKQAGDNHPRDRPDSQVPQVASDEGTPPEPPFPPDEATVAERVGLETPPTTASQPDTAPAPADEPKPKRLPRLLEIGAEICIPCQMMQPILAELREEYAGKLQIESIDLSKKPGEADKYGVQVIPTQVFFDASGKEVYRHIGFFPKEQVVAKLAELGVK